jgi:hypothetical protein
MTWSRDEYTVKTTTGSDDSPVSMKARMFVQDCSAAAASIGISCTCKDVSRDWRALLHHTWRETSLHSGLEHTGIASCCCCYVCLMYTAYRAARNVNRCRCCNSATLACDANTRAWRANSERVELVEAAEVAATLTKGRLSLMRLMRAMQGRAARRRAAAHLIDTQS